MVVRFNCYFDKNLEQSQVMGLRAFLWRIILITLIAHQLWWHHSLGKGHWGGL